MITVLSLSLLAAAVIAAGRKMALDLERARPQPERDDLDALLREAGISPAAGRDERPHHPGGRIPKD